MRTRNSMTLLLAFGFYIPVALAADAEIGTQDCVMFRVE